MTGFPVGSVVSLSGVKGRIFHSEHGSIGVKWDTGSENWFYHGNPLIDKIIIDNPCPLLPKKVGCWSLNESGGCYTALCPTYSPRELVNLCKSVIKELDGKF